MIGFIDKLKSQGFTVEYLRCDNAGENLKFQADSIKAKMKLDVEFTAPGTPQQNGVPESKFATLYGQMRAMMKEQGLDKSKREQLWTKCANTATKLDSVAINSRKLNKRGEYQSISAHKAFYGKDPKWLRHLFKFGEICIVADHANKKQGGNSRTEGFTHSC